MNRVMKIGMPLEGQRATIVAVTPRDYGWLVLCIRWNDFMPYVVWDAVPSSETNGVSFSNGGYCHTIGAAMYQYAHRGGDVSVVNEEEINQ